MQSSFVSGGYGGSALRDLLRLMQANQASGAGQNVQGASSSPSASGSDPVQTQTQSPTPLADAAGQFATMTLASLLNHQQPSAWASSIASQLIGQLDTDGDGQLSLSEVEKALGATTNDQQSALSQAFAQVDANGDGQISQSELTSAILKQQQDQDGGGVRPLHGHHHHHEAATATQVAQDIINVLAPSGGGLLSLGALESDLGLTGPNSPDAVSGAAGTSAATGSAPDGSTASGSTTGGSSPFASSLSQAFDSLDTNGDGQISVSELASAIQAFRQAQEASWSTAWTNGSAGASASV